jgi:predicted PurR-regulated permease PerM
MSAERQGPVRISFNWIFVGLIVIVLAVAMWQIRSILLLTFASVVLVIAFTIPVRWLTALDLPIGPGSGRRMSRGAAIALTLLGFIVLIVVLSLLVFPTLFAQFETLFNDVLPRGVEQFVAWINSEEFNVQFPFLEDFLNNITTETINDAAAQVLGALGQVSGTVIPLVGGVANALFSLIIVLFLSMYLLAEPDLYINRVIRYTPVAYRGRMLHILRRMDATVRAWLRITVVSMIVTAFLTGLGLALLGVNEWVALGTLAGLASFIPNFGPLIALIPSVAVGLVQSSSVAGIVLVVYGVSFVQSQLVAPILANESMQLPPVMILVGQVVFGIFFGFLGIMFAVPITALFLLLLDEIYVRDILGDVSEPVTTTPKTVEVASGVVASQG